MYKKETTNALIPTWIINNYVYNDVETKLIIVVGEWGKWW